MAACRTSDVQKVDAKEIAEIMEPTRREITRQSDEVSKPCQRARATLDGARRIDSILRKNAIANERMGALSEEVVDALHEGGFFGIWVPKALQGAEMGPIESIEIIEQLSSADASTGWVTFASALAIGTGAAYLGETAVREIFRGERFPVIAGQGIPNGRAEVAEGGYILSGSWSYGSGIKHADYIHTGAIVYENGSPRMGKGGTEPEGRIFVVPRDKFTYGDNWDVIGLRGTGSIDYIMQPAFVPAEFTHVNHEKRPQRGGALYSLGIIGLATLGHGAFALGVGRRMLDEIAALAQTKSGPAGTLRESETFHLEYARAEAKCRAARAFMFEVWNDIERSINRGDPASTRQITLARLALNNATWSIHEVCLFAYKAGGGIALRQGTIQRLFRDMSAAAQHVTSSLPVLRDCGRELAGMVKGKEWGFIGLVDSH
jgi:alkylation response protein AidB-like acyl-CoA dehydrogenase